MKILKQFSVSYIVAFVNLASCYIIIIGKNFRMSIQKTLNEEDIQIVEEQLQKINVVNAERVKVINVSGQ